MSFRNPVTTLPASSITGPIPASQISGQLLDAQIAAISAAKIGGQLTSDQIAALDAAKIGGQLTSAQIAAVAADKVTGQLSNAQLAAIDAAKVTGQLSAAQIASVNAVALSGQLTAAQIVSLTAAQITGTLTASQIAAVSAAAVTGQLKGTQLAADSIDGKTITGATLNGTTVTGGTVQTATSGKRWKMSSTTANQLQAFTGSALGEAVPGRLLVDMNLGESSTGGDQGWLSLEPPKLGATSSKVGATAGITMIGQSRDGHDLGALLLHGDSVSIDGTVNASNLMDSGLVTSIAGAFTLSAGWSCSLFRARTFGPMVYVSMGIAYSGATVTADILGDIANQTVGTFAVGWRPQSYGALPNFGGKGTAMFYVNSGGGLTLALVAPNRQLVSGDGFTIAGVWMTSTP